MLQRIEALAGEGKGPSRFVEGGLFFHRQQEILHQSLLKRTRNTLWQSKSYQILLLVK